MIIDEIPIYSTLDLIQIAFERFPNQQTKGSNIVISVSRDQQRAWMFFIVIKIFRDTKIEHLIKRSSTNVSQIAIFKRYFLMIQRSPAARKFRLVNGNAWSIKHGVYDNMYFTKENEVFLQRLSAWRDASES